MWWPEEERPNLWRGLDLTILGVDQAYLNVSTAATDIALYSLSSDCHQCPYSFDGAVHKSRVFTIDTKHSASWRLYSRADNIININDTRLLECEVFSDEIGQFGVYDLIHNVSNCSLDTASPPVHTIYSLAYVVCFLLAVAIIATIISLRRLYMEDNVEEEGEKSAKKSRVRSLDTFRGVTLVLMVFVNDGAGGYWFLEHATWHGLLMADVLFPWFLWIMGVCVPISVKSQFKRGLPRATMFLNTVKRACTLFLLGIMLNTVAAGPDLTSLRVFGILQRFGITYLVVSSLVIFLTPMTSPNKPKDIPSALCDVTSLLGPWVATIAILLIHWYLTFHVSVPGCPLGYLDAGGIQEMGLFSNCTGGISRYVDEILVGESHMYQTPTVSMVYHTAAPFDPEGFLGCLTSVVQVFLGVQAGTTLLTYPRTRDRVTRWVLWGIICGVIAAVLVNHTNIPINKNLWTVSFVFATTSLAFILFSLCYLLVDHYVFWNGAPFVFPGMNSITVYVGHMVCYQMFPWHWHLKTMNTHFLLTVESVWGTSLWILIAFWLYTKKCFIAV